MASRRWRQLVRSVRQAARNYRGFHFFVEQDERVLQAIARGEFQLRGLTNGELRVRLPGRSSGPVSRLLKRLRVPGLMRKIARSYRYHLTGFAQRLIALAFQLRETVVLPELELIRAAAGEIPASVVQRSMTSALTVGARSLSADQIKIAEEEAQLGGCRVGSVGAVDRIAFDAGSKLVANGAFGGFR